MKRRILSVFLGLCLLLSCVCPVHADMDIQEGYSQPKGEDILEVTLRIHSNLSSMTELEGLYCDNVFYIDYKAVCELTGCRIISQDYSQVVFSMHGGLRKITVTEQCRLTETFGHDQFAMDIPTALWNAKLYISAPHILRYMGATVGFSGSAAFGPHMTVSMPYTVLDLYQEFTENDGYCFYWREADGKFVDPETMKYLAVIDTVYFGYDSHLVIQGLSGSYSELVMEELYRDVVLKVIRTSGAELVEAEDPALTMLGDVSGEILASEAWIEAVLAWANFDGADTLVSDILSQGEYVFMDDIAGGAKHFVKITGGMANALQTVLQYSAVNSGQRDVLVNSLNRVTKGSSVYNISPDIFDAAKLAQQMIDDEQLAAERSAKKLLFDLAVDVITDKIPVVSTVASVSEILSTTVQSIPFFASILSMEECITVAFVANQIESLSCTLLDADAERITISATKGTDYQEYARADMLLSLKASLLARQQLIASGSLTDWAASSMESLNQRAAKLLNKAENAQCILAEAPSVTEDLTWIALLAGKGLMGTSVVSGQYLYYWKYDSEAFPEGAIMGGYETNHPATLIRRDADGKEEALFDAIACQIVVTANRIFYSSSGTVCSRDTDGSNYKEWTPGSILDVDSYGNYLVFSHSGGYYSLNTWTGETHKLFEEGTYEGFHNGVVYYSTPTAYVEPDWSYAQMGKLTLRAVDVDGSNDRLVVTTKPDLYSAGRASTQSAVSVQQIRFGKDGLYFSYGGIAGTGQFFQGGKIIYVSYDGTESRIVAGEPELVDANFGIEENGSLETSNGIVFVYNQTHMDYYVHENVLYWMDRDTGIAREVTKASAFSSAIESDYYHIGDLQVWAEQAIFTVHFAYTDWSQSLGWREYAVRLGSITYLLDLETGNLTELHRF